MRRQIFRQMKQKMTCKVARRSLCGIAEHILKRNFTKNFSPAFHDLESGFTQTLLLQH